jgi:hypothetical protein
MWVKTEVRARWLDADFAAMSANTVKSPWHVRKLSYIGSRTAPLAGRLTLVNDIEMQLG